MADILNSISNIIREDLMFVERASEPKVDGIFSKMYDTSEGVVRGGGRSAAGGGGFQVLHTFATGVSGHFRNLAAGGDSTISFPTSNTIQSTVYNPSTAFPVTSEVTAPGYVQKTITLVEGLGAFSIPIHLLQAEQLDATIAKPVSLTIRGTAKKVAQSEAIDFYQTGGAAHKVADLLDVSVVVADGPATSNKSVTITFTGDNTQIDGRIARIYPGMLLDLLNSAGALQNASGGDIGADGALIVGNVDYVNRTFDLYHSDGTTEVHYVDDFADGDYLVLRDSGGSSNTNYGPTGIDAWTTDTSTSIFGLDVTTHSQFKSVVAAVNNVLDESTLNQYVGSFYDAYGDMIDLDSFITTAGVVNQYIENLDGLFRYDRGTGAQLKLREGWSSFDYGYMGKNFELLISRYCQNGTLYGCQLGGQNLKRYVPKLIPGTGKKAEFAPEIQWYAPLAGSKNVFLPARNSSGAPTRYLEAQFFCFREVCPEYIQGIKLTGLTELFV